MHLEEEKVLGGDGPDGCDHDLIHVASVDGKGVIPLAIVLNRVDHAGVRAAPAKETAESLFDIGAGGVRVALDKRIAIQNGTATQ